MLLVFTLLNFSFHCCSCSLVWRLNFLIKTKCSQTRKTSSKSRPRTFNFQITLYKKTENGRKTSLNCPRSILKEGCLQCIQNASLFFTLGPWPWSQWQKQKARKSPGWTWSGPAPGAVTLWEPWCFLTLCLLFADSVHASGYRDSCRKVQLCCTGHAGALVARRGCCEDLQPDRWGPGLVEGRD